ncbi:MAG: type I methionyl aminopeptidase [Patescibacteria group bacterium]|nr:type I methionyl aminopeptidase [Patescibacteria group bacterium]
MILIKTPEEIEIMKQGGKFLARILQKTKEIVRPGITTKELDKFAENLIFQCGAKPAFKGYDGFPCVLCASVNEEIVHTVPCERILKKGDIVSLDCGLIWKGFYTDMAITVGVGEISLEKKTLLNITREALNRGIKKAKNGNTFGDIGNVIQEYVEKQGFNIVRELCGHGIGRDLHEDPLILNYSKPRIGPKIREGMVFCLEPMVTIGDWRIKKGKDGQCLETKDGSLSAHFEHMVAITKNGAKVLTASI